MKMSAVVNVVVDNYVYVSSFVVLLVSVLVLVLWRRKPQTTGGGTVDDEFLIDEAQPRSKKTVKSKPKKTKPDKVLALVDKFTTQRFSL